MEISVFYSWQSDSPSAVNKTFIENVLRDAIVEVSPDNTFRIDASLDRDTKGVAGAPAIADTILSKIDKCGIFVADVTLVAKTERNKQSPNPNVLFELGYAVARLGWERIILVMNTAFGTPEDLPFDFQHRRWPIRYKLSEPIQPPNASYDLPNKKSSKSLLNQQSLLTQNLGYAIATILQNIPATSFINPKDRRVAEKLYAAINDIVSEFAVYLVTYEYKDGMKIILEDYPDVPGTEYPEPNLVDPILDVLFQNGLKGTSNMTTTDNQELSWAEAFLYFLKQADQRCESIMDKFADRDEKLIDVIDKVQIRSHGLLSVMNIVNIPELASLYDKGIHENNKEEFRYFFLELLRATRIMREFGVYIK